MKYAGGAAGAQHLVEAQQKDPAVLGRLEGNRAVRASPANKALPEHRSRLQRQQDRLLPPHVLLDHLHAAAHHHAHGIQTLTFQENELPFRVIFGHRTKTLQHRADLSFLDLSKQLHLM